MSDRYSDKRIEELARGAEALGWQQANKGRTQVGVAEDMVTLEGLYGPLSEQERLIAQSHMDEEYRLVDSILKHPPRRR